MNGKQIKVLYFGRLAEVIGKREETQVLESAMAGSEWLARLAQVYPDIAPVNRLKLAVNQHHVPHHTLIQPGDEVAVFEPVTGG